jgi:hypothetical protein
VRKGNTPIKQGGTEGAKHGVPARIYSSPAASCFPGPLAIRFFDRRNQSGTRQLQSASYQHHVSKMFYPQ